MAKEVKKYTQKEMDAARLNEFHRGKREGRAELQEQLRRLIDVRSPDEQDEAEGHYY